MGVKGRTPYNMDLLIFDIPINMLCFFKLGLYKLITLSYIQFFRIVNFSRMVFPLLLKSVSSLLFGFYFLVAYSCFLDLTPTLTSIICLDDSLDGNPYLCNTTSCPGANKKRKKSVAVPVVASIASFLVLLGSLTILWSSRRRREQSILLNLSLVLTLSAKIFIYMKT